MQKKTLTPLDAPTTKSHTQTEEISKAKTRYKLAWFVAFFSRWRFMSWLNPANGIALAAIALPIGTILSGVLVGVVPEGTRIISDMISVSAIGAGLLFAAATIIPFILWEASKHYQEWKQAHAEKFEQPPHYGHYLLAIPNQISQWVIKHPGQAFVIAIGLVLTTLMMGFGIGFFMGDDFSMRLFSPVVNRIPAMLYWGLHGLGEVPGLSLLNPDLLFSTSEVSNSWVTLQIIAIVLLAALPLTIADVIRRTAQTEYEARQAGGKLVGGEGEGFNPLKLKNEANLQHYRLLKNSFKEMFSSEPQTTKPTDKGSNRPLSLTGK